MLFFLSDIVSIARNEREFFRYIVNSLIFYVNYMRVEQMCLEVECRTSTMQVNEYDALDR